MPLVPLRISERSEQQLLTICEQPEEHLEAAYAQLASIKEPIIAPKVLRSKLQDPLPAGVVLALVQQLIALRSYADQIHRTPADAVSALSLGIKDKKWPEETAAKWSKIAPIIEKFLTLDNVITTAKALELSFDFEHVFADANILTDIRPVYSPERKNIIGGIVCSRLRIKFDDENGRKSFSIAMDKDDIENLKTACADALRKIELASELMNKSGGLPTFATGEGYDDFS